MDKLGSVCSEKVIESMRVNGTYTNASGRVALYVTMTLSGLYTGYVYTRSKSSQNIHTSTGTSVEASTLPEYSVSTEISRLLSLYNEEERYNHNPLHPRSRMAAVIVGASSHLLSKLPPQCD